MRRQEGQLYKFNITEILSLSPEEHRILLFHF